MNRVNIDVSVLLCVQYCYLNYKPLFSRLKPKTLVPLRVSLFLLTLVLALQLCTTYIISSSHLGTTLPIHVECLGGLIFNTVTRRVARGPVFDF